MADGKKRVEEATGAGHRRGKSAAQAWRAGVLRACLRASTPRLRGQAATALALFCLLAPQAATAQQTAKSIEGKVLAAGSNAPALPGAIIYLQDTKTNVIKTLIAIKDGSYRFSQLPADTDYQLWAEYQGKKSKVRVISSFDTKRDLTCDFHIGSK